MQHISELKPDFLRDGEIVETPIERRMIRGLREARKALGWTRVRIEREVWIRGFRVDFLLTFPGGPRLVVECDGFTYHYESRAQIRADRRRDRMLQAWGYHVARYTSDDLSSQARALRRAFAAFRMGEKIAGSSSRWED